MSLRWPDTQHIASEPPEPVPGVGPGAGTSAFTLGDLIAAILRHKGLVIATALAGALGGALIGRQLTVSYLAEATLIADTSLSGIVDMTHGDMQPVIDPSATSTIVDTVGSPAVVSRALQTFPPELRARLLEGSDIGKQADASADAPAVDTESLLADHIWENLQIFNSGRSYVVYVRYSAEDPDTAAEVANAIARAYLEYRSEMSWRSYEQMLGSLGGEIATLKVELQDAERTAQTMREQVRLLALRSEALAGRPQLEAIEENSNLYARQRQAEREAEATASVYERLLLSQREIQSRLATPELNVQLFSEATAPLKPSGFNLAPVLLVLGLVGGICAGASLALASERLGWRFGKRTKTRRA